MTLRETTRTRYYIIIIITELYVQKLFDSETCEMKTYIV